MVVGALCIRHDKILMAKRNINPRKGLWTLPAGFMENAETLEEGALRETFEETCSKAEAIMPYTMFSLPHINQIHFFYPLDCLMSLNLTSDFQDLYQIKFRNHLIFHILLYQNILSRWIDKLGFYLLNLG